ncbi:MAG: hypothetical protein WC449_02830 [Candidatus Paceibacterota bacterium]
MTDQFSQLIEGANFSKQSVGILNTNDLAQAFEEAKGLGIEEIGGTEDITLITLVLDDSGSMDGDSAKQLMLGYKDFIEELKNTKRKSSILVHVRFLNSGSMFPYCLVDQAPCMDSSNYHPDGSTPLYDGIGEAMAVVAAKTQEYEDAGISVKTITLVMTDGCENDSHHFNEAKLKCVVNDLIATEKHIVAAMGFGEENFFRQCFGGVGIPDKWIYTSLSAARDIRRAFNLFSKSATKASNNTQSFSQTAQAGIFGA